MATSHGIVFKDAPTSPGTEDYTKAGLGTVKGYFLFGSEPVAVNTDFADVQWHVGCSDLAAVNGVLVGCNYEDDSVAADTKTLMHLTRLMGVATAGQDTETEGCNHNATITDGIQVDWTVTAGEVLTTAILLKEGIDNFDVRLVTLAGTGATTVTPGFQPDVIICIPAGQASISYGPNDTRGGVQFYKVSSGTYAGVLWNGNHGDTAPQCARYFTEASIGGNVNETNGALDNEYTLGNFTATQFDATKVAQTQARVVMFISIKLSSGYNVAVGTASAPGSTGVDPTITGLDHTPQIALFSCSGLSGGEGGDTNGSNFSFGACDADAEVCMGGWMEDSLDVTQNTNGGGFHRNDSCIYMPEVNNASLRNKAAFSAFQSGGVDLTWPTATDIMSIAYLTIGPDNGGGAGGGDHDTGRGIGGGIGRGIG